MAYFLWSFPALAVVALIASGRIGLSAVSSAGMALSLIIGLTAAPKEFAFADAVLSIARGGWIGAIVVPYIVGGLLFWRFALRQAADTPIGLPHLADIRNRRRALFTACFLIGPFAEAATGFGAGILGALAAIGGLGLAPQALRVFLLLSQTMILWGAMGSGVIVAAAYADIDPTALALQCSPLVALMQMIWLPLFWKAAERAGITAGKAEMLSEVVWLTASLIAVIAATYFLGPEVAMLAAFGPLIGIRWFIDQEYDLAQARTAIQRIMPFVVLIGLLVISRLYQPLSALLQDTGKMQPFINAPAWSPLFHAGSWLVLGALVFASLKQDWVGLRAETLASWKIGRVAVLSVIQFSIMAEILSGSGIAGALATGVFELAGRWALLATPLITGIFALITNGGNAPNGLFMASQISLGRLADLSIPAVVALQHFSGSMTSMFSPVRMSIVCALAGTPGSERATYLDFVPHIISLAMVLMIFAALITMRFI